MLKKLIVIVSIISLTGCSTTFSIVHPDKLSKPEHIKTIELKEDFVTSKEIGWKTLWNYRLKAGTYAAEYEDTEGTFYRGPEKFYIEQSEYTPPAGNAFEGGLWLAKCSNKVAQHRFDIYTYIGDTPILEDTAPLPPIVTSMPPLQAGIGAGLGAGIVTLLISMDYGKIAPKNFPKRIDEAASQQLQEIIFSQFEPCP